MAEQSVALTFAYGTNSLINDAAKNAIELAIKSKVFSDSLALKIPGIKLSLVGNVDKLINVVVAWDSGNGTTDAVGKAVFEGISGVLAGIGGGFAGRAAATIPILASVGAQWWAPPIGAYLADKGGEFIGGILWDQLPESTRKGLTCNTIDMLGLDLTFCMNPSSTISAPHLPAAAETFKVTSDGSNYSAYAITSNSSRNIVTGEVLTRDPDAVNGNYIVQKGDNLYMIGVRNGWTEQEIEAFNQQITHPWLIHPGQVINVPQHTTTDLFTLTIDGSPLPEQKKVQDLIQQTNDIINQYLCRDGVCTIISNVGEDVNEDSGNQAMANYALTNENRVGNNNTLTDVPWSILAPVTSEELVNNIVTRSALNLQFENLLYLTPTDPLVLDLNGDGVVLTDFATSPVLFDADHDGAYEQAGWASAQDGILVMDLNSNEKIDDIAETLSEYFTGEEGEGGSPGTKPFAHGFAALASLDSDHNGVFNSADTAWNSVQVWIDANHDGKSWIDTDGDGVKDAGEATELVSLSSLGITSINLSYSTQSGLVRDGNEILASGTFTMNGETEEALAANFLYNPNGHDFNPSGNGTINHHPGRCAGR